MAVPLGADSEFRWACPWGKIVHEWKTTNLRRMDDVQMGVASGWVGLSLRRVWVSASVSVGWSTDFVTDSRTGTDGRRANGSRFGLGGLVPAADSGFRRACPWGKAVHEFFPRINEWTMCKWQSLRSGRACPCGGLWVSGGVSVGLVN